jgi:transglutaminase-like putative cysteine protease
MKRGTALFLLLALLLIPALASPADFETITMRMNVHGTAIVPDNVQKVELLTQRIPATDGRQSVSCTVPVADGMTRFTWEGTQPAIDYSCSVSVKRIGTVFSGKEPFPFSALAELSQFLTGSERVRLTPETILLAQNITSGAETEFEALAKIGAWVNGNLRYDKTYFGRSLPSDEVLKVRAGVCEEFAHLFIALARSVGIPARYVGGYSWGVAPDRTEGAAFGAHGWAEAYFPGAGWVPFDPTFGQFGYVDTGHVKFYTSRDSAYSIDEVKSVFTGPTPRISWKIDEPSFEVISEGAPAESPAVTELSAVPSSAKSGEAVLVRAELINPTGIPAAPKLGLSYWARNFADEDNLKMIGQNDAPVLLPGGTGSAYYLLKTPIVPQGVRYNFPIEIAVGRAFSDRATEIEVRSSSHSSSAAVSGDYATVGAPAGNYELIGIDNGFRRQFAVGGSGSAQVPLAGFSGTVFSTTGDYFSVQKTSGDISVSLEPVIYSDQEIINATIFSPEAVSGTAGEQTFSVPAGGTTVPLKISGEDLTIILKNQEGKDTVITKTVRKIPRPLISLSLPEKLSQGENSLTDVVRVKNGRLVSVTFSTEAGTTDGNNLTLSITGCGQASLGYRALYEDEAGRPSEMSGTRVLEIQCSDFLSLLERFLRWLFG